MASFWKRIAGFWAAAQSSMSFGTMDHDMIARLGGGHSTAGRSVNEASVLGISAAWCCRRILAESVGMLPWSIYSKEKNGNSTPAPDYWLQEILVRSPNVDQTSVEFRESLMLNLTGDGNAYSLIETLGNRITSLTPVPSTEVVPMRKDGTNTNLKIPERAIFFRLNDRGRPEDFPREKIWQVKGCGHNSLRGLSPIGAAKEAMGGALAMEEFANRFFSQGAMPSATISVPQWLTDNQKKEAQEALNKMAGLGRAHSVALFQGGMKPEPWNTMNMEEMQFLVARKFSVLEICRFYRVPPHMVAELEKGASYASIEQMSQEFVMFTLMPYITRLESSVTKWLIPRQDREKYFLRFNYEGLLRAASKERADYESVLVQNGIMTRNEVRAKENLNRVDESGMDDLTVQLNLTPIQKLGQQEEKPVRESVVDKGNTSVQANIVLPEKHEYNVRHEVEVVDVKESVNAMNESQKSINARMDSLESSLRLMIDSIREGLAGMKDAMLDVAQHAKAASRPRKAVVMFKDTPQEEIFSVPVDDDRSIH